MLCMTYYNKDINSSFSTIKLSCKFITLHLIPNHSPKANVFAVLFFKTQNINTQYYICDFNFMSFNCSLLIYCCQSPTNSDINYENKC